jgi:hypothetical protein
MKITKLISLILIITIFVVLVWMFVKKRDGDPNSENYEKIIDTYNLKSLQKNFVLDNPLENGSDPTGGTVDYSFAMEKDNEGKLVKNINGDIFWNDIPSSIPSSKMIQDVSGGIKIQMDDKVQDDGRIGTVRLSSRKLFRGGLFIFDVEHIPVGCGIWPALWLNGFVGSLDQYHAKKDTSLYKEGMEKLVKTTTGGIENYTNKTCDDKNNNSILDQNLTEWVGKPVYVGNWPMGGEIDIIEQVNFSKTNLISIHGGSNCEVSADLKDTNWAQDWIEKDTKKYENLGLRSICNDPGCKDTIDNQDTKFNDRYTCPSKSTNNAGNSQIIVKDGGYGEEFNKLDGGVYVTQWIPQERIYVWWYPRSKFTKSNLSQYKGPLSNNPDPKNWDSYNKNDGTKILVASYNLNDENAMKKGCDLNFQAIILNITVNGGWSSGTFPAYCSQSESSDPSNFLKKCINASVKRAQNNQDGSTDPETGCYDGAKNPTPNGRGIDSEPVFYEEAYFKIRNIKVYQRKGDMNIW